MKKVSVFLVVSIVLMLSLSSCGLVGDMSDLNKAGNAFMSALSTGDAATSWDMLVSDVQTEIGSEATWEEFVSTRNFSDWNFNETNIDNSVGQLDGEATLGSDTYTIRLVLDKVDGVWKISGINITFKE